MSSLPGIEEVTLLDTKILATLVGARMGKSAKLASNNADAGSSPTTLFRKGNVITYYTAGGTFVEADDANADADTAPVVTALITNPGSGAWDGVITVSGQWGSFPTTLSGDNTDAAVAAAINSAAATLGMDAHVEASVSGSRVVLTGAKAGGDTWLKATHATVTTIYGASGTSDAGTDALTLITDEPALLIDSAGAAVSKLVRTWEIGEFVESALVVGGAAATSSVSWPTIKARLVRRGCKLV